MRNPLAIFRSRRVAVLFVLGFSSGLPLLLTGQTIQQWLYDSKVDLKTLATFAAVGLPYTLKFAFVAAQMSMCNPAVSATQMALLTSLTSVGQRVFGTFGADVVESVGWRGFFVVTMAMGLPGIVLAWFAMREPPAPKVEVPVARVFE